MGPLAVAPGFIPYCMYWLLGNPFSLDGYLAQLRYSREGLGPSSKQCVLSSQGVDGKWGRGEGGGSGNWDCYVK